MDPKLNEGPLYHLRFNLKWMSFLWIWHMPQYKNPLILTCHRFMVVSALIMSILTTTSGIIGFFRSFKYETELITAHALLFCMETMLMGNFFFFAIKREAFDQTLKSFKRCYKQAIQTNPKGFLRLFKPWSNFARRFSLIWTLVIMSSGIHWFSVPLLNMFFTYLETLRSNQTEIAYTYTLPFVGWYPYDKWSSIYYEITYFMESVVSVSYVYYFGVIDSFIIAYLILCCGHLDHLLNCIRRMQEKRSNYSIEIYEQKTILNHQQDFDNNDDNEIQFDLRSCVKLHREVFGMFEDFKLLISPLMLSLSLRTLCALCLFSLDFIYVKPGDSKFIILIEYLLLYSLQFFLYTWFSSDVTKMGKMVSSEIYFSNWIPATSQYKRNISFMIMRSQKLLLLTGGPFFSIDLGLLIQMYRTSFSIFTVLRQMKED